MSDSGINSGILNASMQQLRENLLSQPERLPIILDLIKVMGDAIGGGDQSCETLVMVMRSDSGTKGDFIRAALLTAANLGLSLALADRPGLSSKLRTAWTHTPEWEQ